MAGGGKAGFMYGGVGRVQKRGIAEEPICCGNGCGGQAWLVWVQEEAAGSGAGNEYDRRPSTLVRITRRATSQSSMSQEEVPAQGSGGGGGRNGAYGGAGNPPY